MVKYLSLHNFSFALRFFLKNVNGKATMCDTPFASERPSCFDDAHFFGIGATFPSCFHTLALFGQTQDKKTLMCNNPLHTLHTTQIE
jgi:hypothetical protein